MDQRCLLPGKQKSLVRVTPKSSRMKSFALRGVAAAMAMMISTGAMAATLRCADPEDQAMFELSALKTELMVVAITCKDTDAYNAFVSRFQSALAANDKQVIDHFTWRDTRAGHRANDAYVTNLANSRQQEASRVGADLCARNTRLFKEVMALSGPAELADYAAAKDLIPASMGACPLENTGPARATSTAKPRQARR
ncbi:hypothetical protein IAI18_22195 [Acetobacteraceae bacterium H6797]|nr:hypothetical protein [Acetobacteraceae bacterium H6797]